MSLMHQALDRPVKPEQTIGSGYNPLQRVARPASQRWWVVAGVASLASLALLVLPLLRPAPEPALLLPAGSTGTSPANRALIERTRVVDRTLAPTPATEPEPELITPKEAPIAATTPIPVTKITEDTSPSPEPVARAESSDSAGQQTQAVMPEAKSPTPLQPAPAQPPPERAQRPDAVPASSVARAIPRHSDARQAVQAAISRGEMEHAQQLLTFWIEREPELEEPRIWLAKILLGSRRTQDAEALLVRLESPEALGLRGLILEQTERYADAVRVFETLTRDDSSNPQWWLHWAINLENSGRMAEARLLYQTYLQQFSSHNARLTAFASERYVALAEL